MADAIPILVDPNKEQSLKDAYAGYALAGLLAARYGGGGIKELVEITQDLIALGEIEGQDYEVGKERMNVIKDRLAKINSNRDFDSIAAVYKLINAAWSIAELMVRGRRGPLTPEKSESES